jgi:hypothetical protein
VEKGDEYSKRLAKMEKSFNKSKILGDEGIRMTHKFETSRINVYIKGVVLLYLGNSCQKLNIRYCP